MNEIDTNRETNNAKEILNELFYVKEGCCKPNESKTYICGGLNLKNEIVYCKDCANEINFLKTKARQLKRTLLSWRVFIEDLVNYRPCCDEEDFLEGSSCYACKHIKLKLINLNEALTVLKDILEEGK